MQIRLQKFLSDAGIASRRASEELITSGRVLVNGLLSKQLGIKVTPGHDKVEVDGKPVKTKRKLYVAVHKPRGCLCTRSDPQHRFTIGELLPGEWNHLYPVGRLDNESEGLIFMTNDGEFSLRLTHPRYGITKCYTATVHGRLDPGLMNALMKGIMHQGEKLQAKKARLLSSSKSASIIELELAEGKNREIRRMFESQGLAVNRLIRTRIGPIRLGELRPGKWRTLTESEINSLLQSL